MTFQSLDLFIELSLSIIPKKASAGLFLMAYSRHSPLSLPLLVLRKFSMHLLQTQKKNTKTAMGSFSLIGLSSRLNQSVKTPEPESAPKFLVFLYQSTGTMLACLKLMHNKFNLTTCCLQNYFT